MMARSRMSSIDSSQETPTRTVFDRPAPAQEEPPTDEEVVAPIAPAGRIARFCVLRAIGQGGMGRVYSAYDPQLDRRVAIKVLRTSRGEQAEAEQLRREAQALAKLNHPNIVGVHELGEVDGTSFIAMEYVEGRNLSEWLSEFSDTPDAARLDILRQVGRAVAAAHAAGVVHRDLKPSNILIGLDDRVRVVDFGLARAARRGPDAETSALFAGTLDLTHHEAPTDETREGLAVGTPAYMAPEQHLGHGASEHSDQFAFCLLAWEVFFGCRPFPTAPLNERLDSIRGARLARGTRRGETATAVESVLRRGLSFSPNRRHRDMTSLLGALPLEAFERNDRPSRSTTMLAVLGAGMVVLPTVAFIAQKEPPSCSGSSTYVERVWDEKRASALDRRVEETAPQTIASWPKIRAWAEDYAERWTLAHREACAATSIRGEQSQAVMDEKMHCLNRALFELDAVIRTIERDPSAAINSWTNLVTTARPLDLCAEVDWLKSRRRPPWVEPALGQDMERRLASAWAQMNAAAPDIALEEALDILDELPAGPPNSFEAELRLLIGRCTSAIGRDDEARTSLYRALELAVQAGDDYLTSTTLSATSMHDVSFERDLTAALERASTARVFASRLPSAKEAMLRALRAESAVLAALGKTDDALRELEEAQGLAAALPDGGVLMCELELQAANLKRAQQDTRGTELALNVARDCFGRELDPSHPWLARVKLATAKHLAQTADPKGARARAEEAVHMLTKAFGAEHPEVADANLELARTLIDIGDLAQAEVLAERSIATLEEALGREHPKVGSARVVLGNAYYYQGAVTKAERTLREARDDLEAALGANHPLVAGATNALGGALHRAQKFTDAELFYRRALELRIEAYGEEHPLVAQSRLNVGIALLGQEKFEAAESTIREAAALQERLAPHDEVMRRLFVYNLALAIFRQSRFDDAIEALREAHALYTRHPGPIMHRAHLEFLLAKCFHARNETDSAREWAERALARLRTAEDVPVHEAVKEIELWKALNLDERR